MTGGGVDAGAERRHPDAAIEVHRLDAVVGVVGADLAADGAASVEALSVMIGRRSGEVFFHAVRLRPGLPPIVVAEEGIRVPPSGWEIRHSGLWADHVCEEPMVHWSYGLEAFGLAIDRPDELFHRAVGDRVAIGWELEFEAGGPALSSGPTRYAQPGEVHGVILDGAAATTGGQSTEVDGRGVRSHWWGPDEVDTHPSTVIVGDLPDPDPDSDSAVTTRVTLPSPIGRWDLALAVDPTGVEPAALGVALVADC